MRKFLFATLLLFGLNAFTQQNMALLGQYEFNSLINDVWGYEKGQDEYALVGRRDGFSIVDVTDAQNLTEVFSVDGPMSTWRDMKTWSHYAYVTNESDSGLLIVDLQHLGDSTNLPYKYYKGENFQFSSAHNIYIDENGVAYIFGADYGIGGAILLFLDADPFNPIELGVFDEFYIHDGMVRGDTLWASAISNGFNAAVDVSDKANPSLMAQWTTPNSFTHNCWISDDANHIFTTDEVNGAYIASYDISDLDNVQELDVYQSNPGSFSAPHNTHFINDYLVTSYYRDGITVVDCARENNMVEVANYDTSPLSGPGFEGCWGAYPWLGSGKVLATDVQEGLFVLQPFYTRAAYLEGQITDALCSVPLSGVLVTISGEQAQKFSNFQGNYATGVAQNGTYTVSFSKFGYQTQTIQVSLTTGQLSPENIQLTPSSPLVSLSGSIVDAFSQPIAGARVQLSNDSIEYNFTTDALGNFEKCNVIQGQYDVVAGKWGQSMYCEEDRSVNPSNNNLQLTLTRAYEDNFTLDFGWIENTTAVKAPWQRGIPTPTVDQSTGLFANPNQDSDDCGEYAFVTGNLGGDIWFDDIDEGMTFLSSPWFDLQGLTAPVLTFQTWYYTTNVSTNNPLNDYLKVFIVNQQDTILLLTIDSSSVMSSWQAHSFELENYVNVNDSFQVMVEAVDIDPGNIVEAGFDDFKIQDQSNSVNVQKSVVDEYSIFPSVAVDEIVAFKNGVGFEGDLTIFDAQSRKVLEKRVSKGQRIEVGALKKGIYFVQFNAVRTLKTIIKQ